MRKSSCCLRVLLVSSPRLENRRRSEFACFRAFIGCRVVDSEAWECVVAPLPSVRESDTTENHQRPVGNARSFVRGSARSPLNVMEFLPGDSFEICSQTRKDPCSSVVLALGWFAGRLVE